MGEEMDVKIYLLVMLIGFLSALYHADTQLYRPNEKPERAPSN